MLIVIAAIVITRIIDMEVGNENMFLAHKCLFAIGMVLSFARVLKICIRFRYVSVFLKIAGKLFFFCLLYSVIVKVSFHQSHGQRVISLILPLWYSSKIKTYFK